MNTIKSLLSKSMQQMGMIESLSIKVVIVSFAVAFICAVMIYIVYRWFYKGVSQSPGFGLLLIMLTLITNFIILCISTNLVLSLGMVGALSIVRFRAAVKEPLDVGFLFFAIAAGLAAGARLFWVAIIGTLIILLIFILCYFLFHGASSFLLVIRYTEKAEELIRDQLKDQELKLKSKIKHDNITEITYSF